MKSNILGICVIVPFLLSACTGSGPSDEDLIASIASENTSFFGDADYKVIGIDSEEQSTRKNGEVHTLFKVTLETSEPLYKADSYVYDINKKRYNYGRLSVKEGESFQVIFKAFSSQNPDGVWVTNTKVDTIPYNLGLTALNDNVLDQDGAKYKKVIVDRKAAGYFFDWDSAGTNYGKCIEGTAQTSPTSDFTIVDGGPHVIHKKTGLMWARCVWGQKWSVKHSTCVGQKKYMNVEELWANKDNQGFSGKWYKNWRIATIDELDSLVDRRCGFESINPEVFPNFPRNTDVRRAHNKLKIWSSTPVKEGDDVNQYNARFWALNFSDKNRGTVRPEYVGASYLLFVRNP